MTLVLTNSAPQPTITVSREGDDGSIRLYLGQGLVLSPEEAQRLAKYILDAQPQPEVPEIDADEFDPLG